MKNIILTNTKEFTAIVDDEDFEYLNQFTWSQSRGYIQARAEGKHFYMHRLIMKATEGKELDHINRIKYDNRKENLRFCTHKENCANKIIDKEAIAKKMQGNKRYGKSRYVGVRFIKGKWMAKIEKSGKAITKTCKTEIGAARKYDEFAIEWYGDDAKTNFKWRKKKKGKETIQPLEDAELPNGD